VICVPKGAVGYRTSRYHSTFATHTHIRGLDAVVASAEKKELALGA